MSTCPCCTARDFTEAFATSERSFDGKETVGVVYLTCGGCGFTTKEPTPLGLDDYYANNWQSPTRPIEEEAAWLARVLRPHTGGTVESALDVGSRDSALLRELQEHLTLNSVVALDPNRGDGFVGSRRFVPEGKHQLVCCCHVLEHVPDVGRFMEHLYQLTDGFLFLEVPSPELECHRSRLDDICRTHLRHFSMMSLISLAQKHGFGVLQASSEDSDGLLHNRVLLTNSTLKAKRIMQEVFHMNALDYQRVVGRFAGMDPKVTGLYGISDAYWRFRSVDLRVKAFPAFDRYRGTLKGIEKVDVVVLMPRQAEVRQSIKDDLDAQGIHWVDPWS